MKRGIALMLGLILAAIASASTPRNTTETGQRHYLPEATDLSNQADSDRVSPGYHTAATRQQQERAAALTGVWENREIELTLASLRFPPAAPDMTLKHPSLRFEFRKDGSFTRRLCDKASKLQFEEHGRWEVSGDGNVLLLHFPDADGGAYTQRIGIKYLEMDELVLDQPLSVVGQEFASVGASDFFFNKQ